ncbi:hypothetical protein SERLADRAFT_392708, partial [Serpula lacrymans var. lacrymans S7.9]
YSSHLLRYSALRGSTDESKPAYWPVLYSGGTTTQTALMDSFFITIRSNGNRDAMSTYSV